MSKIIIFSAFYDPFISGAERMVKEVVERLQDRHSFIIVTARLSRRIKNYELRIMGNKKYEIARVGFGLKIDKYLYPFIAPLYALRHKPKIVHAVMESYAGIAIMIYHYLSKILKPLIPNSCFLILTLQSGDLDLPEKQARIPKWLWRGIHCASDLVVSIGNSMAERARRLGAKNVRVVPNGVDLELIQKSIKAQEHKSKIIDNEFHRIICVARLSPEKGIEYLLDAMPKILKHFPDANLVIIGDGKLKQSFEFRISNFEFSAKEAIKLVGAMSHDNVLKEISNAEVLVLPSLAEGMGIVLVEAQALGVPVIGTNVGGIPDVIEHGKTGLLVPPRDSRAIAKAVILLLRDRELREGVAREAKTRLAKFDWQTIAEQYHQIYDLRFKNQES